jgi:hypothetical protein
VLIDEQSKAGAILSFFDAVLGTPPAREDAIDLDELGLSRVDLAGLTSRFMEDEIWGVIWNIPGDKAPGPDGFTAWFL